MILVQDNSARAVIVTEDDPSGEMRKAAGVLIEYVEKSTGARLALQHKGDTRSTDVIIHVGLDTYTTDVMPFLLDTDEDGFVIQTVDDSHLVIAGPTQRGTEYGVYTFLERFVGIRWLLPGSDGEHVPKRTDLTIPSIRIREEPVFLSRTQPGLSTPDQQLWGRRQRLHERFKGATHTIQNLFPPAKYAKSHPEFFPLINGERYLSPKGWDWHPCFTAEGLAEEAAKIIKDYFRRHPEETSHSIGISDGAVHCECATCCRSAEHGQKNWLGMRHVSEQYFRWANRVAELVTEEFPNKWLGCLAYSNVFQAPSNVRVHPRVVVFHTYDRHKWIHPDLEQEGHRLADEWREACPNMAWYDYTFGQGFMVPRIYFHHMGDVYRYAGILDLKAITAESVHNWAEGPKSYLLAKLQWNPDLDVDALLTDWYECAVGIDAAPYLSAYYELWEDIWTKRILASNAFSLKGQQWLPLHNDTYFDVLDRTDFAESRHLLEKAVAYAEAGKQRKRAQMLLRGFEYYEASAYARLPDIDAGRSMLANADEALQLIGRMPDAVTASLKRRSLKEELESDQVLGNAVPKFWSGLNGWGWGAYPLWRAFEWITKDKRVRARVEAMACDTSNRHSALHARSVLDVVDLSLDSGTEMETLVVDEMTRQSKEPGDHIPSDIWQLTIGDDVDAFWNIPHDGNRGQMRYEKAGGRSGQDVIVCEGVEYGTIRRKLTHMEGAVTALCSIHTSENSWTDGRVVLNLWQICWTDHNPSPFRIVAYPQPGVWTPVALPVFLQTYVGRDPDYLLYELEVEGFAEHERLEISDMAIWPLADISPEK
ncbi:MAG TPA: DUF4838 domain-containing protein [candidate division Zixibacteria bacterium]|nr:DUF4838 domain-containing protein [candidate division Zixibacteria bacterium]